MFCKLIYTCWMKDFTAEEAGVQRYLGVIFEIASNFFLFNFNSTIFSVLTPLKLEIWVQC